MGYNISKFLLFISDPFQNFPGSNKPQKEKRVNKHGFWLILAEFRCFLGNFYVLLKGELKDF